MDRETSLPEALAAAVTQSAYLDDVTSRLEPYGFAPSSTLPAVSICRDELTQHLIAAVTERWGPTFALGGLGGVPSLGRTGWGACLAHVPDSVERGKLLVIGATHIGIGPDGSPGHNLRHNQSEPTPTCGALSALLATWGDRQHAGAPESRLADDEAVLLRKLVESELGGEPEGIVELTLAATGAVEAEMMTQLDALEPWDRMDVAVFTGVQIHLVGAEDRVLGVNAVLRGEGGATTSLTGLRG